jgi:hypothetical protein
MSYTHQVRNNRIYRYLEEQQQRKAQYNQQ